MIGDVSVVGLTPGTVILADIALDVPHGVVVHIPADKAASSKDLWRAINQRTLFQLSSSPVRRGQAQPPTEDLRALRAQVTHLEAENAALRAQVKAGSDIQAGMAEVLALLKTRPVETVVREVSVETGRHVPSGRTNGVVEVDAPMFIPGQIKSDSMRAEISIPSETSTTGAVSGATEALRRLKRSREP